MNKETICLYGGYMNFPVDKIKKYDEESIITDSLGGSDSWFIYMANSMRNAGFDVTVVCDCERYHLTKNGIKFCPLKDAYMFLHGTRFRYLISNDEYVGLKFFDAEIKIMMVHGNTFKVFDDTDRAVFSENDYYRICYLSEFQKRRFIEEYGLQETWKFQKVRIGIDWGLYDDANLYDKKNKMVWSSHKTRGLGFFIENIFPLIRQRVPDFELEFCSYLDETNGLYDNIEGVTNLGQLTKQELANKQKEAKIWVYPNTGVFDDGKLAGETFCLTCVENVAAGNAVIVADKHGFSDTLSGYSGFVGTDLFDEDSWVMEDEGKRKRFAEVLAERAVDLLLDEEYRQRLVNESHEICKQYTFDNALIDIIKVIKKGYYRTDLSEYMVDTVKTRMVFHWWIPSVKPRHYHKINELHLECLKNYNTRFNESIMVLSCDDLSDPYIEEFKRKIYDIGLTGDIHIKIVENNIIYREAITYNNEILFKMDELDGITFFAHNKGTSRYDMDNHDKEELLKQWIVFMYFMNLEDFNHVRHHLSTPVALCYGTMLYHNNDNTFYFNKHNWAYLGSFQWLNTKKIFDYIGKKKTSYDPADAELYIPNYIPFNTEMVRSYFTCYAEYPFNEDHWMNLYESRKLFEETISQQATDEHLTLFYDFYKRLISNNQNLQFGV